MRSGHERLIRRKWMLDGLKDAKHKRFDASFCVVLDFLRVAPPSINTHFCVRSLAELDPGAGP